MDTDGLTQTFACGFAGSADASPRRLGNKAANLTRMAQAGLPVPPGFVIATDVCQAVLRQRGGLPSNVVEAVADNVALLESATGMGFGQLRRPLLVSVRSGAAVSMPGMMDTVLNVGLCDRTVDPLIRMTGNPRFVWDSYRRLIQAFGQVVAGIAGRAFDGLLQRQLRHHGVRRVDELDFDALRTLANESLRLYASVRGEPFPQDPRQQLHRAIEAVFRSWERPRAVEYRRLHHIDSQLGTAVTVQAMVYGNLGGASGSGVGFTRDPTTGENQLYLDYLWNAQGEDVVSGRYSVGDGSELRRVLPAIDHQLHQVGRELEQLFRDVQDFEFTIQDGKLYLLQSRGAKRTPWAMLRTTCELVDEGLISAAEALERLSGLELESIRLTSMASQDHEPPLGQGVMACPGVATGPIAFNSETASAMAERGTPPILVRPDLSTDDIAGLAVSAGMLTATGGKTAHAAVVARQLNKVCIVGCRDLRWETDRRCRIGDRTLQEGEVISLDGNSATIYAGTLQPQIEIPARWLERVEQLRREMCSAPSTDSGER